MIYSSLQLPKQLEELAIRAEQVIISLFSSPKWMLHTCATISLTIPINVLTFSSNLRNFHKLLCLLGHIAVKGYRSALNYGKILWVIRLLPWKYQILTRNKKNKKENRNKKLKIRQSDCYCLDVLNCCISKILFWISNRAIFKITDKLELNNFYAHFKFIFSVKKQNANCIIFAFLKRCFKL